MQVLDCFYDLLQIPNRLGLREFLVKLELGIEVAALSVLKEEIDFVFICFDAVVELYDAWVVNLFHYLDLLQNRAF